MVTNDGIELEAIRKFGTRSVLFSIVHDFYNFKLAIENADLVDYFICHTEVFSKALLSDPSPTAAVYNTCFTALKLSEEKTRVKRRSQPEIRQ